MGKHAYLIMAHNQFELLEKLVRCLDSDRADIFIHLDKKASYDQNRLMNHIKESSLFFTERIQVTWGGYSQIAVELLLLEKATSVGKYDYYHLITGVDFPLKSQKEILSFFDQHSDLEFISCTECSEKDLKRVKKFYFFQDLLGEKVTGRIARKITVFVQKLMHIQRSNSVKSWGIGSAYFDITDDFARYIVNNKSVIRGKFKFTRCADEMFLQTMFLNSPFAKTKCLYKSEDEKHKYIQKKYLDVVRAIDWTRGNPFVYGIEDLDMLLNSKCLFARKFDYSKSPEIVNKLFEFNLKEKNVI